MSCFSSGFFLTTFDYKLFDNFFKQAILQTIYKFISLKFSTCIFFIPWISLYRDGSCTFKQQTEFGDRNQRGI